MSNPLEPNLQKRGKKQPNAMASLRTNKPLLYTVIAIAVALAVIVILVKMKSKPAEVAPAKAVLTVETVKPSRQDWPMNLTVNHQVDHRLHRRSQLMNVEHHHLRTADHLHLTRVIP